MGVRVSQTINGVANPRLVGLQLLRALAALLVVYAHVAARLVKRDLLSASDVWLTEAGNFGVCVFFCISGYVMIHTCWSKFGAPDTLPAVGDFLKRRIIRIYPLYLVTTLAALAFTYATRGETYGVTEIAKSLAFIPYRDEMGLYQPVYSLGWSLNYEIFFYAILVCTLKFPRPVAIGMMLTVIAGLVLIGVFVANAETEFLQAAYFYTRPIMAYFVAGILARFIPLTSFEIRLSRYNMLVIGWAVLMLIASYRTHSHTLLAAMFTACFVRAAANYVSYANLHRSATRVLEFLGDASYSLYLTHSFVVGAVTITAAGMIANRTIAIGAGMAGALLAAILTASLCYVLVERPMTRALSRWILGKRSTPPLPEAKGPDVTGNQASRAT